jgi:hypothetical protein
MGSHTWASKGKWLCWKSTAPSGKSGLPSQIQDSFPATRACALEMFSFLHRASEGSRSSSVSVIRFQAAACMGEAILIGGCIDASTGEWG